jgi:hypothetical protein
LDQKDLMLYNKDDGDNCRDIPALGWLNPELYKTATATKMLYRFPDFEMSRHNYIQLSE